MFTITATEKATGNKYELCENGVNHWFAPLGTDRVYKMPKNRAEDTLDSLQTIQIVWLFRDVRNGVAANAEKVNLVGFKLGVEAAS